MENKFTKIIEQIEKQREEIRNEFLDKREKYLNSPAALKSTGGDLMGFGFNPSIIEMHRLEEKKEKIQDLYERGPKKFL